MKHIFRFLIFYLILSFNFLFSQQKAFPTAFGGGAFATGGRIGNVYHVNNLNDSGVGSFRWALSLPRPATIVFDVSGIIDLITPLQINGNNLTIAGQTSPEGGITLTYPSAGKLTFGDSQNIVMRYLRIRPRFQGDTALQVYPGSSEGDEASNLIFDHLSISYAGLQGFTVRGRETHNITFQNGLIAESKTGSLFGDTDPDSAGYSYDNTFRATLFYNISHRTPNSSSGRADIYNNVIYDWKNRWTVVKTNALVNHFNNYYYTGNKTSLFYQFQSQDPVWHVNGATNENPSFPPSIYTSGNIVQDLFEDPAADNQFLWIEHAFSSQTESVDPALFTSTQHPMIGAVPTVMTALEASITVPQDSGAYKFLNADGSVGIFRDAQDTRYVNNTLNDTPEPWDNSGGTDNRHTAIDQQPYADFLASITGEPITTRPENFYNPAKSEHIPEVFYDLYMPVGASHNDIAPSGYTWLEEYLNGVDGEVIDVPVVSLDIETPQNFTGLNLSESVDLDVTFNPTNATNQNGTWTTSNDGILEVNNSGIVTAVGIGTATIRFTSAFDATLFDEITIDVFFSASAGDDERVCENDDYLVELTATEGDSYLWSTEETTQSIFVSPLSTTNYSVEVTLGQAQSTADVTVFVDPNPNVIIENGTSVDILNGDFVTITASGANTYEWNNGASQPNIAVSPSQTTTYDVRGYINDCYDDKSIVVNVFEPVVAYAGENVLICLDESVVLTASGGTEFLWSTGETTPSIEVAPTETTDYFVTVFNPIDFDEASVTVEVDASCATEPIDGIDGNTTLGMHMYPNPANSTVNIKLTGTFETSEVEFYDITGKRVLIKEITNEFYNPTVSAQVDISRFTAGIYFVKLKDDGGEVTKKLIVK